MCALFDWVVFKEKYLKNEPLWFYLHKIAFWIIIYIFSSRNELLFLLKNNVTVASLINDDKLKKKLLLFSAELKFSSFQLTWGMT